MNATHTLDVLVNDHDPKPLRYQFKYEHAGQFAREYLENGPETWRVHVRKRTLTVEV